MRDEHFDLAAKLLIDQHYASGPSELKKVVAEALAAAASGQLEPASNPREQLKQEVDEAIAASARGSE